MSDLCELVLYACPVGKLEEQLEAYFACSRTRCGENAAHQYMPHCTLTGFFRSEPAKIPLYIQALSRTLRAALPTMPNPVIAVTGMQLAPEIHCLELESPWLRQLVAKFATRVVSATRQESLRPKRWLHLSLAYGFDPGHRRALEQLAARMVDPQAPVTWEMRFYERRPDGSWMCHARWPLRT